MLPYFLLGVTLLVGLVLLSRWFATANPKTLLKILRRIGWVVSAVVLVWLVASGRLGYALGLLFALLPWIVSFVRGARTAKTYARMAGVGAGQTSNVETRFLRMSLDHDSGELNGQVIDGPYAGRRLSDMTLTDLLDLLRLCRLEDPQSERLLEAYLDRAHPSWRQGEGQGEANDADQNAAGKVGGSRLGGGMTREEAYQVLGLEPGASEADIKTAHHRLIAGLHPDKGGSSFLAAQVNRAKDILLGR